jgi:hypothetical protein
MYRVELYARVRHIPAGRAEHQDVVHEAQVEQAGPRHPLARANFSLWPRLSKKSRGPKYFKQLFKVLGDVESMLLQAQPAGTIVAQNLSAPTSSTASAIRVGFERRPERPVNP